MLLLCSQVAVATPVDAPELALPGPHAVGVQFERIDVGPVPGSTAERRIDALLWYPSSAAATPAPQQLTRELQAHPWRPLPKTPMRVAMPSVAVPAAPLLPGAKLPVVVVSHGLLNWAAGMAYLAEHLASRGYLVLGLEHDDEAAAEPLQAALLLRPIDQAAAVRALQRWHGTAAHPLHQRVDLDRIALVGYSMGGYGALVTAGARVATDGMAYGYVPGGVMAQHAQPLDAAALPLRARIGAVVAIAPWGGQAAIGALKAAGLAGVKAPTLVVVGEQDDISGYSDGVRSLWDQLTGASRWLLVYENARHNIGQQNAPAALMDNFRGFTAFEEPVWRRERILDINRHFITAFLDLTLRGDKEREVFLRPATPRSSDGAWPEAFGAPATGRYAGAPAGAITHWAGFQRRWALGLRLERGLAAP